MLLRWTAFLMQKKELAFQIRICTDADQAEEMEKDRPADILVITDACPRARRKKFHAGNIFVLTESEHTEVNPGETPLYRYQSGETLLGEILQNCGQELRTAGEIFLQKKKQSMRVIGVYSPVHRTGKTSYALQIGQKIGVSAHTLYLNMELYGGGWRTFSRRREYYRRCVVLFQDGGEGSGLDADRDGQTYGAFGLSAAARVSEDIKTVPAKDWEQLLRQILTEGMYEAVILDLDDGGYRVYTDCSGCVQRFMCRCSRIGSELLKCSSLKKSCICLDMMMSERSFRKKESLR